LTLCQISREASLAGLSIPPPPTPAPQRLSDVTDDDLPADSDGTDDDATDDSALDGSCANDDSGPGGSDNGGSADDGSGMQRLTGKGSGRSPQPAGPGL
jgi:hypothetical protein